MLGMLAIAGTGYGLIGLLVIIPDPSFRAHPTP
jgi:hypothetical protein